MSDPLPRQPFRFSTPVSVTSDARSFRDHVRRMEDLGFSTVTISDHFDDQLGPIAALQAAADATTTLRVGSLVFCNDYRHPVVLAKEAATLDLLSEGRFELGLGAGWMESDYTQAGLPYDAAATRVDRLDEAIQVIRRLWGGEPVAFTGQHYSVDGLVGTPVPHTPGGPPLVVGGGGRRVLELAARHADVVGINPKLTAGRIDASAGPSATPSATDAKVAWIRDAAGARFESIELHVRLELAVVTDDPEPLVQALSGGFGLTPDEARATPHAAVGTIDSICDALVERRERWGLSYVGIPAGSVDAMAPVVSRLAGT